VLLLFCACADSYTITDSYFWLILFPLLSELLQLHASPLLSFLFLSRTSMLNMYFVSCYVASALLPRWMLLSDSKRILLKVEFWDCGVVYAVWYLGTRFWAQNVDIKYTMWYVTHRVFVPLAKYICERLEMHKKLNFAVHRAKPTSVVRTFLLG
jgi:hypothetical protein